MLQIIGAAAFGRMVGNRKKKVTKSCGTSGSNSALLWLEAQPPEQAHPLRNWLPRRLAGLNIEAKGLTKQDRQVVSRRRVADHGEVYADLREVNAMLDLVEQEATRIDSRFLEPACGTGNFLAAILERKLRSVESRCSNRQLDYERNAILAVSSLYGIDILEDNVAVCHQRLFDVFERQYNSLFKGAATDALLLSIRAKPHIHGRPWNECRMSVGSHIT